MTIYSVKINKHEVVKTTALHEAMNLAKRALKDKIAAKGLHPVSVCEKMYLDNGRTTYRIFASVYEKNWQGVSRVKTYSNSIRMEHIGQGGYNFELHKEISDAVEEAKKNENR